MTKYFLLAALLLGSGANASMFDSNRERMIEDTFILYALDAQMHQKFQQASEFFSELYKETDKKEYLYQSLKMLEQANATDQLEKATYASLKKLPEDTMLRRFEVIVLMKEGKYAQASQKAFTLSNQTKKVPDYLLYADSRLKLGDYAGAVGALEKAYAITYDDDTVERIALIRYSHLQEREEAVKELKDHIGAHGNSAVVAKRLASFYLDQGHFDDAAALYEETYDTYADPAAADGALKIYLYQKNFVRMQALLEKSHLNDPLLLDVYVQQKNFPNASKLAGKLYEQENNPLYLAQSAVFLFEGTQDKKDKEVIARVVEGLEKALTDLEDPLYLNYLGYLLIDNDLNVPEGMKYVRRALEKQPDSPYYIDSLAWGKYKIGECEEARALMDKVQSMIGSDEAEVKEHIEALKSCKSKEKN